MHFILPPPTFPAADSPRSQGPRIVAQKGIQGRPHGSTVQSRTITGDCALTSKKHHLHQLKLQLQHDKEKKSTSVEKPAANGTLHLRVETDINPPRSVANSAQEKSCSKPVNQCDGGTQQQDGPPTPWKRVMQRKES